MYYPYHIPYYLSNPNYMPAYYSTQHQAHTPASPSTVYDRILPPTQPERLMKSAENTKLLLADAAVVNEKLRTSPDFVKQLATAASQSDHQTVHYLINNLAIQNRALISYSPGGISITLIPQDEANSCCYIVMFLNWKDYF
ncbi:hypothetical protein [Bacillus sp. 1P06AnD]|uniref:hypothetical protein n=1 Tax=Bacillus sp. 1P06AnD TaxID=3132208 RepID=UPI0039A1EEED